MDPISIGTLAAVSLGSTILGGATSAIGAAQAGAAAQSMYNYQAAIGMMNAENARRNADYERARGEVEAQQAGLETKAKVGQIRAAFGAGNLDVNSGTPTDVQESESMLGQFREATIRNDAARKGYNFEIDAANYTNQANLLRVSGEQSKIASDFKVAGSVLGTAESVSNKWIQARNAGIWGA